MTGTIIGIVIAILLIFIIGIYFALSTSAAAAAAAEQAKQQELQAQLNMENARKAAEQAKQQQIADQAAAEQAKQQVQQVQQTVQQTVQQAPVKYPPPKLSDTQNYNIKQISSGKCLKFGGPGPGGGSNIIFQSNCTNDPGNLFKFLPNGMIVNNGACVLPSGGSSQPSNLNPAILWGGCNLSPLVQYTVTEDGQIQHSGGKCLDSKTGLSNPQDGTPLVYYDCVQATKYNVIPV
jgi:hypothetical protein